jgi:hypothetical protein
VRGCFTSAVLLFTLFAYAFSCWLAFAQAALIVKSTPLIPLHYVPLYGYSLAADVVLILFILWRQKWAFWCFALLCLVATFLEVQYLHATLGRAALFHLTGPVIVFVALYLGGSWELME